MPWVKKSIKKIFGKNPKTYGNPDESVALGAALWVGIKNPEKLKPLQRKKVEDVSVSEVTHQNFGTVMTQYDEEQEHYKDVVSIIIERGETIPCSKTKSYFTMHDDQEAVKVEVTESRNKETDPEFVNIIWEGRLPLPPGRPAGQEIEVTYSYDENQNMHCAFLDIDSGELMEIDLHESVDEDPDFNIDDFKVD